MYDVHVLLVITESKQVYFQYSDGHQQTHLMSAALCPLYQMAAPLYCAQNYSGCPLTLFPWRC